MSVIERAIDKLRLGGNAVPTPPQETIVARARPSEVEIPAIIEAPLDPRIFIDREALRLAGYLPESDQDRRFADEYRHIKRPLLVSAFGAVPSGQAKLPSPRLVMMASALPGDGKTFTSINLALSLAREKDTSVVLVDGDAAKPHISRIFGVETWPGLLDVLANPNMDVQDLILQTDCRGLSILPAGTAEDGATELLSSGRMKAVANRLIERNPRCIALFDSSPLLVSSESLALASAMGQVVLVVRAGHTPRHAVIDAVESLAEEIPLSLVLNQGRRGLSEGRYGYGYGYGSGYGDQEGKG
jgi:exopolysaccharide/PEP-CTERM locus tyrosine autokinase